MDATTLPTEPETFLLVTLMFVLFHFRLMSSLEAHIERVTGEISNLEAVEKSCKDLQEKLNKLQKEVSKLDVWSKEQQPVADGLKVTAEILN